MKELKAFIKMILCNHDYEYETKFFIMKKHNPIEYEMYHCLKCGKRKEFKAK